MEYLTFAQMESYLQTHVEQSPYVAFRNAMQYYSERNALKRGTPPFSGDLDVLMMPDDDFIALCNELPISELFPGDDIRLSASTFFPHNYECFITRHLDKLDMMMHSHDFFEICYVWAGSCFHLTENQSFSMDAGSFLIIPPGMAHNIESISRGSILFNILVRAEALQSSSFSLLTQHNTISIFLRHCFLQHDHKKCLFIQTDNSPILKRIIKHLTHECYIDQDVFCDFAINVFNQLFGFLILSGNVEPGHLDLSENFSLVPILREIQRSYRTITLKELADKFFYREEHLSRQIKKATGKTFSSLLRETRIEQSKLLLTRTDLNLDKISDMVGYSDAASFAKAFRSTCGQSPAHYRRQALSDAASDI